MYNNILIPVALDHEVDVGRAIETARRLMSDRAKITLVAVLEDVPSYVAEYATIKPADHVRDDIKSRLQALADTHGGLATTVLVGKPGVAVANLATEIGADLIVVNSHRPGAEDYFLGSTASRIACTTPGVGFALRGRRATRTTRSLH